mmetsp:Transcript_63402/g.125374  ORF Transcript_63402/g.125374 Transcript_63402/m.125374 type:complete len:284 (-) Transcript_63402:42-893(-)
MCRIGCLCRISTVEPNIMCTISWNLDSRISRLVRQQAPPTESWQMPPLPNCEPRIRILATRFITSVDRLLRAESFLCLVEDAPLEHILVDGHDLHLLDLAGSFLSHDILGQDLKAPLQPCLVVLKLAVLLARHVGQPALAIEDGARHALIQAVLEDSLGERAVKPCVDQPPGLTVALHRRYRVPRLARASAAVEVEDWGAIARCLGCPRLRALRCRALHATARRHLWSPLTPHDHVGERRACVSSGRRRPCAHEQRIAHMDQQREQQQGGAHDCGSSAAEITR